MTIIELNRKKTTFRNKVSKVKNFINIFQPTDSTKDYITLKSKLDNIKNIIKELDILQNDYCALPDKINLNDALDSLSDLQDEAEETKFMNLIGNNPSLNEVQKLCYLKGALKNEASLIQSDQDTFDSLLKALEVRYENTRALVDIHIAEILSINKLNSENPSQIRSIIDKEPSCLGESKQTAVNSVKFVMAKIRCQSNLKQLYRDFIHEYLDMGHMEQLSDESEPTVFILYAASWCITSRLQIHTA
ncbi:DUF1758 domain-containing protein [Trichonephila clavipes]|nr:DUF1758 domain-containing protein [Trichonephila clavipes]